MRPPSRKQRLVAEINITPFTDVILVLLVIFMIATPLISASSIKVKLPKAQSGQEEKEAKQLALAITITREGPVYLGQELVTRQELRAKMRILAKNNPGLAVTISSDRAVAFRDIVAVLDILSELGITRLNISTTKEE